jgi:peroxygenase
MLRRAAALSLVLLVAGCGQAPSPIGGARDASPVAAAGTPKAETALQRHVQYFDDNGDGLIVPAETIKGARALGVGAIQARLLAVGLHGALGPKSSGKMTTEIRIANIHRGVHPGSINFDQNGEFKPAQFQAMFADYDTDRSGALSRGEIAEMLKRRKKTAASYYLSKTAFSVLLAVAGDVREGQAKEPALSRSRLQAFYDGSLFPTIARERAAAAKPDVELDGAELHVPAEAGDR